MGKKESDQNWYQIESDGEKTKFRTEDYGKFEKLVKFAISVDSDMTVKELLDRLKKKQTGESEN